MVGEKDAYFPFLSVYISAAAVSSICLIRWTFFPQNLPLCEQQLAANWTNF
jgi:hypothetical protein